ncbi:MAG: hypothetical protein FJZ79_06530 [Chlorobi bacterium]|nr:hypothetical protein [Chlorobiota bacterium]
MMQKSLFSAFMTIVFLGFSFLFSGCSLPGETGADPAELYRKAALLSGKGAYAEALFLYNKAIAADTTDGRLPERAVLAIDRKRRLEGLVGAYDAALRTTGFLEKRAGRVLPDSLRAAMIADKAAWLSELGDFRGASAALAAISRPSEEQRFEQASLMLLAGDIRSAESLYARYARQEEDPVAAMRGMAGLLQCRVLQSEPGDKEADHLAMTIASLSGKVFALEGDLARRVQALRESARSLQLLEKHRRNASFLLFRALSIAERAGNPFLVQLLRYESNAVIVQKPVPYRETADFFDMKEMQFAESAALLRLATGSPDLGPSERIDALRRGLLLYRNSMPRYPGAEMLSLAERAQRQLAGFLVRQKRVFELFDALQHSEMLSLRRNLPDRSGYLALGKQHEALEQEIYRLQREISGLLQRKANIFLKGRGFEMNRAAETALQEKRGRLFELIGEVKNINPQAAAALQMTPVTLQTLQRELKSGQLAVKPLVADSFFAVMTISKHGFGVSGTPVPFDSSYSPDTGLRRLNKRFAAHAVQDGIESFRREPDARWFAHALVESLEPVLSGYDHLLVAADPAIPVHVLGSGSVMAYEKKISMIASLSEIAYASLASDRKNNADSIRFYPAERIDKAQLRALFHPGERIFLFWKPAETKAQRLLRNTLRQGKAGENMPASAIYRLIRTETGEDKETLLFVTAYGNR